MRRALTALPVASLLLLAGCGAGTTTPASPPADSPAPSANPPGEVGEATEEEVGAGWDEVPDTPIAEEEDLSDDERSDFLRLEATDPARETSCRPEDLTGQLRYWDAALGHRFGSILLRNDADTDCTLSGFPGLGARGEWGNKFHVEAEQELYHRPEEHLARDVDGEAPPPVSLAPGEIAEAYLEWTGALAGSGSEWAQTLYVQTDREATPVAVPMDLQAIVEDPQDPMYPGEPLSIDIGMFTKLRVGPFEEPGEYVFRLADEYELLPPGDTR
ncbi:DUF4232 domain-containing protein [Zhihengliuella salsuginis]|uniref:DUF4232 domain-containing protein n=1 Tax=Zhihengliuella salsuginis TaxID=578222 RepID=A0ABQ3GIS4_9MICC|nr:DUF4232 domain-containing protein [Zhihengliuella salsuginis]GHD09385.1 hypothetical protein GCM10008096_21990 [Zhihengliuella salsuginis]